MKVFFKVYDSKMASREKLFKAATEFANQIGQERLITLTHSEDRDNVVITVWYWAEAEEKPLTKIPGKTSPPTPPPGTLPRPPLESLTKTPPTPSKPPPAAKPAPVVTKLTPEEERAITTTPFEPNLPRKSDEDPGALPPP